MRSYTGAMRTNRTARLSRPAARHAHLDRRPSLAAMLVAATVAAAVTILVTTAVAALACYLAGAPARAPKAAPRSSTAAAAPLLDLSVGRGADSATCKHAPRSPRCHDEGGSGLWAPRHSDGRALTPATDSPDVLLGSEDVAGPVRMPGRVPGRGGWVSEQGPSAA